MIDLDDRHALDAGDPGGMLAAVSGAGEQLSEAVHRARAVADLPSGEGVEHVVVCGMGGSGIAGDVLAASCGDRLHVPVAVVKGYRLPGFVGRRSLVLCASYSGNTEETLACFDQAHARGARIVCVTTGGALAKGAADTSSPSVSPVEGLQPRAALWSLAVPPIVILERMGLLPDQGADLARAARLLVDAARAFGPDAPTERNPAKLLARRLSRLIPLVWGQEGVLAVAALRWRCQLNENAKIPAFSSALPELDHNELAGYDPGLSSLDQVGLVVLRGPDEDARMRARIAASVEVARARVARVEEVRAEGPSPLCVLASAIALGDFASVYLAMGRGVDPTPVTAIERLKRILAGEA